MTFFLNPIGASTVMSGSDTPCGICCLAPVVFLCVRFFFARVSFVAAIYTTGKPLARTCVLSTAVINTSAGPMLLRANSGI